MSQVSFQNFQNYGNFGVNRPDPSEMKAKIDAKLIAAGATQDEIEAAGPSGIQALAAKLGVSLPQPPQRNNESIFAQEGNRPQGGDMKEKVDSDLKAAGATDAEITAASAQGFEGIKALAAQYGISLPEPPARTQQGGGEDMKAKIDAQLLAAGATEDELASIAGPEDVQTLAAKYGVTLPEPPSKGSTQSSSSVGGLSQIISLLTNMLGGTSNTTSNSSYDTSLLTSLLGSLGSGSSVLA